MEGNDRPIRPADPKKNPFQPGISDNAGPEAGGNQPSSSTTPPPPSKPAAPSKPPDQDALAHDKTNQSIQSIQSQSNDHRNNDDTKSESGISVASYKSFNEYKEGRRSRKAVSLDEDTEEGSEVQWMRNFACIRLFLLVLGRWPLTHIHREDRRGYTFRFYWGCAGFYFFLFGVIFTIYALIVSTYNTISILMNEKIQGAKISARSKTEVIEQGLLERHTIIVTIMLGSYIVNLVTSCMIFLKADEIAIMFTRWTRFLHQSRLPAGNFFDTYKIALAAFLNWLVVSIVFVVLVVRRTSATTIGGPTVISIMFMRHCLPNRYLEGGFVGSSLHSAMHGLGLFLYFYVILTCNSFMYLFLWLVKSIDNVFFCWNVRTVGVIEAAYHDGPAEPTASTSAPADDDPEGADTAKPPNIQDLIRKARTGYDVLYRDHIGMVRMIAWFNNMFAFILEPYLLLQLIKIVYEFYLAALVLGSNGKHPNKLLLGKYFMRKKDYIPAFLFMYENLFMVAAILYASAWLEDTTYDTYDEMRKKTLLKEPKSDKEAFFYLSMFQSFTSVTRMSVYTAQFFCIDRYSLLHVLSALMSNFLVVYQFRPLFDMDTTGKRHESLRIIVGDFLTKFEGLPPDHYKAVSDTVRNQESA